MVAATILATLSYRFVERPFRSQRIASRSRTLWAYGGLMACFFLAGAAFSLTSGFARRAPQLARAEQSLELGRPHACINDAERGPILTADCIPPPSTSPVVALLGDSHAEVIERTVGEHAARSQEHTLVMTSFSCPPLQGFTRLSPDHPQHASACAQFNRSALELVTRRPDVKIVVLIGSWAMVKEDKFVPNDDAYDSRHVSSDQSRANLIKGIEMEVRGLEESGKQVILLDDWPSMSFAPIAHIRYSQLPVRREVADLLMGSPLRDASSVSVQRGSTIVPSAEMVRLALIDFAKSDSRLQFIDTKQIVCEGKLCRFSDGTHLLYTDGNHMSRIGAEMILAHLDLGVRPEPISDVRANVGRVPLQ